MKFRIKRALENIRRRMRKLPELILYFDYIVAPECVKCMDFPTEKLFGMVVLKVDDWYMDCFNNGTIDASSFTKALSITPEETLKWEIQRKRHAKKSKR